MLEYTIIAGLILTLWMVNRRRRHWKKTSRSLVDGQLRDSIATIVPALGASLGKHMAPHMAREVTQKAYDLTRERLMAEGQLPDDRWPDEITEKE